MPVLEKVSREQDAVLWSRMGFDGHGEPELASPTAIKVRWNQARREVIDATGAPVAVDATVVVDRDIVLGSRMWLGHITDLPSPVTEQMEVVSFTKTPDIKGREYLRTVGVRRVGAGG